MEDQLLFFSPSADLPLPIFSRYLKHKAKRFQALCWCDEAFKIAGFEGKAELSRPIVPLRLSTVVQKRAICLIPRNSFEEVFRLYTGSSPSAVVIGLEVKGKIKHLSSDFDRYCRLVPQDLSSLLTAFTREKVEELIAERSLQKGQKSTLDKMENEVNALIEKIMELKRHFETLPTLDLLISQVKIRLYRLKMAVEETHHADIHLEPLPNDQLLVINWTNSPIACKFQVNLRYHDDVMGLGKTCEKDGMEELMPGIHKLDLSHDDYEIVHVKVRNMTKVLSNTARFRSSNYPTLPDLNIVPLNTFDYNRRGEPSSASVFPGPRLH